MALTLIYYNRFTKIMQVFLQKIRKYLLKGKTTNSNLSASEDAVEVKFCTSFFKRSRGSSTHALVATAVAKRS